MASTFGERLEAAIKARALDRSALAERVGYTNDQLSKWINGRNHAYYEQAFKLARALDVPLDWLLNDEADAAVPRVVVSPERIAIEALIREMGETEALRRLSQTPSVRLTGRPAH